MNIKKLKNKLEWNRLLDILYIVLLFISISVVTIILTSNQNITFIVLGGILTAILIVLLILNYNKYKKMNNELHELEINPDYARIRPYWSKHQRVIKIKSIGDKKDSSFHRLVMLNEKTWIQFWITDEGVLEIIAPNHLKPKLHTENVKWREELEIEDLPKQVY